MQDRHIAGIEPAVRIGRVLFRLEIALDDPRPAYLERTAGFAIARKNGRPVVQIDRTQFDAEDRPPLLHRLFHLLLEGQFVPVRRWTADRPDGRSLGHSPCVLHARTVLHQPFDHEPRCSGTADRRRFELGQILAFRIAILECRQPDGRHTCAVGHALTIHQVAQHRGVVHRGEDELDPRHRTRIGQAPAGGVEHRDHRQHDGRSAEIECAGLQPGHRVQQG